MKKVLPKKTLSSTKGFTLVELLVVVAIIAILGAIGVSVFSGARQSANDGRRKSEIKSIADAIEASKDYSTRTYKYTLADANKDFPRGIPDDPTVSRSYCIAVNNTSPYTAIASPSANWTGACNLAQPTGAGTNFLSFSTGINNALNTDAPTLGLDDGGIRAWVICASLERGSSPYCLSSLER